MLKLLTGKVAVGAGVIVAVGTGVDVFVDVGSGVFVEVGDGVNVGPKACPGPQLDSSEPTNIARITTREFL